MRRFFETLDQLSEQIKAKAHQSVSARRIEGYGDDDSYVPEPEELLEGLIFKNKVLLTHYILKCWNFQHLINSALTHDQLIALMVDAIQNPLTNKGFMHALHQLSVQVFHASHFFKTQRALREDRTLVEKHLHFLQQALNTVFDKHKALLPSDIQNEDGMLQALIESALSAEQFHEALNIIKAKLIDDIRICISVGSCVSWVCFCTTTLTYRPDALVPVTSLLLQAIRHADDIKYLFQGAETSQIDKKAALLEFLLFPDKLAAAKMDPNRSQSQRRYFYAGDFTVLKKADRMDFLSDLYAFHKKKRKESWKPRYLITAFSKLGKMSADYEKRITTLEQLAEDPNALAVEQRTKFETKLNAYIRKRKHFLAMDTSRWKFDAAVRRIREQPLEVIKDELFNMYFGEVIQYLTHDTSTRIFEALTELILARKRKIEAIPEPAERASLPSPLLPFEQHNTGDDRVETLPSPAAFFNSPILEGIQLSSDSLPSGSFGREPVIPPVIARPTPIKPPKPTSTV